MVPGAPRASVTAERKALIRVVAPPSSSSNQAPGNGDMPRRQREVPLAPRLTEADLTAHRAFVATLGDKPIWNDYLAAAAN